MSCQTKGPKPYPNRHPTDSQLICPHAEPNQLPWSCQNALVVRHLHFTYCTCPESCDFRAAAAKPLQTDPRKALPIPGYKLTRVVQRVFSVHCHCRSRGSRGWLGLVLKLAAGLGILDGLRCFVLGGEKVAEGRAVGKRIGSGKAGWSQCSCKWTVRYGLLYSKFGCQRVVAV